VAVVAVTLAMVGAACSHSPEKSASASSPPTSYYTCPICGMTLVPVYTNALATKP
jgi:hypothetical protein